MYLSKNSLRKQFLVNIAASLSLFVLYVIIGIWIVPYLVRHVGISLYGIVPLAESTVKYFVLIAFSLNGALSRYLTIDIQRKDIESASKTFNTAFWGTCFIVVLFFPVIAVFSYFVPTIFNVPAGHEDYSRILFFGVLFGFLVSLIANNLAAFAFAMNRLDIRNGLSAFKLIIRATFIVILFTLFEAKLWQIGFSYFAESVFFLLGAVLISHKLIPEIKIRLSDFDFKRLHSLMSTGIWMLINQIGAVLFLSIDLIIVNRLFGTETSGQYASVLQWSFLLRSMTGTLCSVLTPIIFSYYAHERNQQITEVMKKAVLILGLLLALPIGLLSGLSPSVLSVWLGPSFAKLGPLLTLMIAPLIINLTVIPLFSVQVALNKVRIPGIVTFAMGVLNLILAILFPIVFGWGIYGVAAAGAIVLTLKNFVFTTLYGSYIAHKPWYTFMSSMIPCLIAASLIAFCSLLIGRSYHINSWFSLFICSAIIGLVYFSVIFISFRNQRDKILALLSSGLSKESQ